MGFFDGNPEPELEPGTGWDGDGGVMWTCWWTRGWGWGWGN